MINPIKALTTKYQARKMAKRVKITKSINNDSPLMYNKLNELKGDVAEFAKDKNIKLTIMPAAGYNWFIEHNMNALVFKIQKGFSNKYGVIFQSPPVEKGGSLTSKAITESIENRLSMKFD